MECGEKSQLKVLVVGGGIGGLTAGIALRQQGHIVQVSCFRSKYVLRF